MLAYLRDPFHPQDASAGPRLMCEGRHRRDRFLPGTIINPLMAEFTGNPWVVLRSHLVGGLNSLKNISQLRLLFPIQYMEK